MGNKSNNLLNANIDVKVNLSQISNFARYDEQRNAFIVDGRMVTKQQTGLSKVIVSATYEDPLGKTHHFTNHFYLRIDDVIEDVVNPPNPNAGNDTDTQPNPSEGSNQQQIIDQ